MKIKLWPFNKQQASKPQSGFLLDNSQSPETFELMSTLSQRLPGGFNSTRHGKHLEVCQQGCKVFRNAYPDGLSRLKKCFIELIVIANAKPEQLRVFYMTVLQCKEKTPLTPEVKKDVVHNQVAQDGGKIITEPVLLQWVNFYYDPSTPLQAQAAQPTPLKEPPLKALPVTKQPPKYQQIYGQFIEYFPNSKARMDGFIQSLKKAKINDDQILVFITTVYECLRQKQIQKPQSVNKLRTILKEIITTQANSSNNVVTVEQLSTWVIPFFIQPKTTPQPAKSTAQK